jgi:hypothetical protein
MNDAFVLLVDHIQFETMFGTGILIAGILFRNKWLKIVHMFYL